MYDIESRTPIRPSPRVRQGMLRLLFAGTVMLAPQAGQAAYRLAPGDSLAIEAVSVPEMKASSVISVDGQVSMPLVGQVQVAGLTLAEAQSKIQALLPTKEFRRRTNEGREFPVILSPSEITVTVDEYRPVYLNGDVAQPGEQKFKPGMTVRQAVSLAGGFDLLRFKMDNPFLQLSELREKHNRAWVQYARQQAVIARLRAELDGKKDIDDRAMKDTPLAPSMTAELLDVERGILKTKNLDASKEKAYLTAAAQKEGDRVRVLTEQESREKEGVQADADEFKRSQDLYERGTIPTNRLTESRRSLLLSSTRALQTTATRAATEREKDTFDYRLQRVDEARRLAVMKELQEANVQLAEIRSILQNTSEQLRYTGMVRSQLVRGLDGDPTVVIVRKDVKDGKKVQRITASNDTELQPGDVVEIALQFGEVADVPTR